MKQHKWWRSHLLMASKPFGHYCAKWLLFVTAFFIWLVLIIVVVVQQPQQDNGTICGRGGGTRLEENDGKTEQEIASCGQIRTKMDTLRTELDTMKREIQRLKEEAISSNPTKHSADQLNSDEPNVYSKEHEMARRELDRLIMELLFTKMGNREEHMDDQRRISDEEQLLHLLAHTQKFAQIDGADQWHHRALARVAARIQNALQTLQHPQECGKRRLLLCELNKGCGFGCQFHHVVYCLVMAAATERTMVLERDGAEWRYSRGGWTSVFRPVGSCTFAENVPSFATIDQFNGVDHQHQNHSRIVRLPVVDGLPSRPAHLPLAFPSQFADSLLTHHSNPPAFFIGQFVNFLMLTKNERANKFVENAMRRIRFELGPVVGLQIRRTDKVGTEAAFHHVNEYMRWADLWFRKEHKKLGIPLQKRVFIATDDKSVIDQARTEWAKKEIEIIANDESAEAAHPSNRYTDRSLLGIIADVHILAHCSYIVCTFSSQVCRLSYELMQAVQGDGADRVHSLDDIFYFGGQLAHEWEAIGAFRSETDQQIELRPGDVIGVAGNHWNGFSKGTNRRTRQSGLFPSYLAREKWRIVNFGIFDHQHNNSDGMAVGEEKLRTD